MSYLLCHGFGFTNDYWKNLTPLLNDDYEFFDQSQHYEKEYIGIGHSIGFQKLNNSGIKFKALIGLQSFLNFCGTDPQIRKLRLDNINRMIDAFSNAPKKALSFFYKFCGHNGNIPIDINLDILIQDLNSMKNSYEHCGVPTLIIGGTNDDVVSYDIIQNNFSNLQNIQTISIDINTHTLGYDKPNVVIDLIQKFLKKIEK